jgi:hypothetical protein
VAVSWSLTALPLHEAARNGGLEWAAAASSSRGVPDRVPDPHPPARVVEVVKAFRVAGCHGRPWFEVIGLDAGSRLPGCPEPGTCADAGGLDLGEIGLHLADPLSPEQPLPPDTAVEGVRFRNPSGAAVLRAVCALTAVAGPLLVCDDLPHHVFVVWPRERAEDLVGDWPW